MRFLLGAVVAIAVVFAGVMGFYWWREGSLESAGAQMDEDVASVEQGTRDLREKVGQVGKDVGEAGAEALDTIQGDGDDGKTDLTDK